MRGFVLGVVLFTCVGCEAVDKIFKKTKEKVAEKLVESTPEMKKEVEDILSGVYKKTDKEASNLLEWIFGVGATALVGKAAYDKAKEKKNG